MLRRPLSALRDFLASEAGGGVVLIAAAGLALLAANLPITAEGYERLLHAATGPVLSPALGPMTVHLWINDALMALFFLLVGAEIKRELVDGQLADRRKRRMPFLAATAGMAVPAAIYLGKPAGLLGAIALAERTGFARRPAHASWRMLLGVACLAGIGFTMSLFIGGLAFTDPAQGAAVKLGVLLGSLLSALAGVAVLRSLPCHPR